jgi:hypothetical protein
MCPRGKPCGNAELLVTIIGSEEKVRIITIIYINTLKIKFIAPILVAL